MRENILFRLYRIQLFQPEPDMFLGTLSPDQALRQMVTPTLSRELKTRRYYVAEFKEADRRSIYFAMARERKIRTTQLEGGHIVEREHPDFPYVDVLIDHNLQICAMSRNSRFAASPIIARNHLRNLLARSEIAKKYRLVIDISPLRDPEDFLVHLYKSKQIREFYFEVRRSNVFDPSEFTKPLKKLNTEAQSKGSRTVLHGADIDKEVCADLTRASAATGDDAGARLRPSFGRRFIRKSLGKNFIDFEWTEVLPDSVEKLVTVARTKYNRVRYGEQQQ